MFTATKWDPAEQKEKFVSHFLRFVKADFKWTLFYNWFYTRLSMTFGHIAHYNKNGFYGTFFTTIKGKVDFLKITLNYPCHGDPEYTYSDAEKVIQKALRDGSYLQKYQKQLAQEIEKEEKAELARLQAKYS